MDIFPNRIYDFLHRALRQIESVLQIFPDNRVFSCEVLQKADQLRLGLIFQKVFQRIRSRF